MTEGPVVYVIDDDASFRKTVSRLLRSAGLAVEALASAKELLERPVVEHPLPARPGHPVAPLGRLRRPQLSELASRIGSRSSAQHTRWQSSHREMRIHPSLLA